MNFQIINERNLKNFQIDVGKKFLLYNLWNNDFRLGTLVEEQESLLFVDDNGDIIPTIEIYQRQYTHFAKCEF